ncbi:MAG: nicotinate-nucleotide adenylyltransferase [Gammaproteobacteria bacterium]|jgi:nicotinate-nucleotide adenylyltransferase
MPKTLKRIGIFGGSFDPVHHGHLQTAVEVLEQTGLDELRFIPTGQSPHKAEQLLSAADRVGALEIALQGKAKFSLDQREIRRAGPSYSVLSLEELRAENPSASICFVLGTDAWEGFANWHRSSEILELCHLLIVTRPGAELPQTGALAEFLHKHLAKDAVQLAQRQAGLVLPLCVSQLEISSTVIRDRLIAGQSVDYLLPQAVANFLQNVRYGE